MKLSIIIIVALCFSCHFTQREAWHNYGVRKRAEDSIGKANRLNKTKPPVK